MIRRPIRRRAGTTLTEVLIAIFVLAIGLLGILTLFPLGALTMAQAIKDDRCALANNNATTLMRVAWYDELVRPYAQREPFIHAMENPSSGDAPTGAPVPPAWQRGLPTVTQTDPRYMPTIPDASFYPASLPSYAVFVDPVGFNNDYKKFTEAQYWLGGKTDGTVSPIPLIPRRTMRRTDYVFVPATGTWQPWAAVSPGYDVIIRNRFLVQCDDLMFGRDGTPTNVQGQSSVNAAPLTSSLERDGRYTWGYLLKRLRTNLGDQCELTVVVYSGRSLDGRSTETVLPDPNNAALPKAWFFKDSTEVRVYYDPAGTKPWIRKGTWILDATMTRPTLVQGVGVVDRPEPHGYFYRIINVTENIPGELLLEIQSPAVASTVQADGTAYGTAVVMDHVAEVFERRTLSNTTAPVP